MSGLYQLTADDVISCASFPDTIGVNGWPIENHVAGDVVWRWPDIPGSRGFNHLPYRMLVPEGFSNLLVAGRCASMTHEGQSAARVSGGLLRRWARRRAPRRIFRLRAMPPARILRLRNCKQRWKAAAPISAANCLE